jgi:hypothetical protein
MKFIPEDLEHYNAAEKEEDIIHFDLPPKNRTRFQDSVS